MATVRFHRFQLAVGEVECWTAPHTTPVFAIVAPAGSLAEDNDGDENEKEALHSPLLLTYVTRLSSDLDRAVRRAAPLYSLDNSAAAGETYRMNHCSVCGAKIGDFHLHHNGASPFFGWPQDNYETQTMVVLGDGWVECAMPYITAPPKRPARKPRR
jgi:hypothetical protein